VFTEIKKPTLRTLCLLLPHQNIVYAYCGISGVFRKATLPYRSHRRHLIYLQVQFNVVRVVSEVETGKPLHGLSTKYWNSPTKSPYWRSKISWDNAPDLRSLEGLCSTWPRKIGEKNKRTEKGGQHREACRGGLGGQVALGVKKKREDWNEGVVNDRGLVRGLMISQASHCVQCGQ